jgi:hypothetical protein
VGCDSVSAPLETVFTTGVAPAVRLRACLALLQAADAMNVEEIGPTSAEGVPAGLDHKRFIESLGGRSVAPSGFLVSSESRE